MRTMDWDRLIAVAPINRLSGLAVGPREPEFDPERTIFRNHELRSEGPLPTKPVHSGQEDLAGHRIGRLTVVGLFDNPECKTRWSKHRRWVVRCVCGYYEVRREKVLKDKTYQDRAECSVCDYTHRVVTGLAKQAPIRHERLEEPHPTKSVRHPEPMPPLMRLYFAVVKGSDDATFGDLAKAADIPREQVRELLDAMVAHGILRQREDGWYTRGILRLK